MYPELACGHSHGSQALEVLHTLKHDSSLEEKEHPELHETEIPVVVEEPETRRKELEDEERSDHMLLVNINELRDGHFHLV